MYINQQDAQNSCDYFPLDALQVSDSVSPSSGAIFCKLYITFGICCNIILNFNVCKRIILITSICKSVSVDKILS